MELAVGPDSLVIGTSVLTLLGTLVGLMGLRVQQLATYRGLATIGFIVAFISTAYMLVSVLASLPINPADNSLGTQVFIGTLLMCLGLILIGVAYLQSGVLPPWASTALIIGMVLYMLLGIGGFIVSIITGVPTFYVAATAADDYMFGCIWLVLGYAIWLRWRAATS